MSIFREIEKKLETVFEGFFAQQFKTKLQPVEIAKKISALIEDERQIGPRHTYVPNQFNVFLSLSDYRSTEGLHEKLKQELEEYILIYVKQNNYHLPGEIKIEFLTNKTLTTGQFLVTALFEEKTPGQNVEATQMLLPEAVNHLAPEAFLQEQKSKKVFPLSEVTALGRSKHNSLVVNDPSASRFHAKIQRKGGSYILFDLNSTNGTYVNQRQVKEAELAPGDIVTIGQTNFLFQIK